MATRGSGPPAARGRCVSGGPGPHPSPRASEAWGEEWAPVWGMEGGVGVYMIFTQQMPLKWLLLLCCLRNPLIFLSSCQTCWQFIAHLPVFSLKRDAEEATMAWDGY